jgi:DNA polymerase III epsilon subunit-like protein
MIVFVDCETGGLRPEHPIIQIGAVAIGEDWTERETFERKVLFDRSVCEAEALALNHYNEAVWKAEALSEEQMVLELKMFLEGFRSVSMMSKRSGKPYKVCRVGGHNLIGFDLERIARAFKRHEQFLPIQFSGALDTMQGAAWYFERGAERNGTVVVDGVRRKRPESLSLQSLCNWFGITYTPHDALSDARACAQLARRLLS